MDQSENGLLKEIQRVARLRTQALERADRYRAELMPLLDKAWGDPAHPSPYRPSLRDLAELTGFNFASLGNMIAEYRQNPEATLHTTSGRHRDPAKQARNHRGNP